jgi:hypothetical protein
MIGWADCWIDYDWEKTAHLLHQQYHLHRTHDHPDLPLDAFHLYRLAEPVADIDTIDELEDFLA